MPESKPLKAFISYKWESEAHNAWVKKLATDLRAAGIEALLDKWEVKLGGSFTDYMTSKINEANFVLFVMTTKSVEAVEAPENEGGAVKFENQMATARRTAGEKMRLIPIYREGRKPAAHVRDHRYADFRDDSQYEQRLLELIKDLRGEPQGPPVRSVPIAAEPSSDDRHPPGIALAATPDYPHLAIEWVNGSGDFLIPAPRDKTADGRSRLLTEAARDGVPDEDWLRAALAPMKARRARKQKKRDRTGETSVMDCLDGLSGDDDLVPDSDLERYALEVRRWYGLTRWLLIKEHEIATNQARSIYVVFTVYNRGRAPAQNVVVELRFPLGLRLDTRCPEGRHWDDPAAPEVPRSIARKLKSRFPKRTIPLAPWYASPTHQRPKAARLAAQLLPLTGEDRPKQTWRARFNLLEHGSSRALEPLCVCFGYQPASDFQIEYRLDASNQQEDARGVLSVRVREMQSAPGSDVPPAASPSKSSTTSATR